MTGRRSARLVVVAATTISLLLLTPATLAGFRTSVSDPPDPLDPLDPVPSSASGAAVAEDRAQLDGVHRLVDVDQEEMPPLVVTASARIEDHVVEPRSQPTGLIVERLGIEAPVFAAGAGEAGAMEVPDGIDDVAWYEFGPAPGETGSAVMAAHVDLAGLGPGVFFRLHELQAGDVVRVIFDDATSQTFEVFESERYLKEDLDTGRIFRRSGPAMLTLVTCGGGFNPSVGRYDSNIVVYAVPTAARAAP